MSSREFDQTSKIYTSVGPPKVPSQPRDRCTLMFITGPQSGSIVTLDEDSVEIGRDPDAPMRVDDTGMSRRHARIFRRNDAWYVEDLGSTNGTWIDGRQVNAPRQLKEGDRIHVGRDTLLRVSLQDEAEQEAAKRLYDAAVRDPLTKVYNRRYLEERLDGEFAFAARHQTQLSILMVDLDHFKSVNDEHGHQAGDAVLRVAAGTLQRMVRAEDLVARYGGEEFVVVARGIDRRNTLILAERVRRLMAGLQIPWEGRSIRLTVSIGVATFSVERRFRDLQSMVAAADDALYRAKDGGRNRCVAAD